MISVESLLRRKVTGEEGPATELEQGTYTLRVQAWSLVRYLLSPSF